jgi:hypothetical protein
MKEMEEITLKLSSVEQYSLAKFQKSQLLLNLLHNLMFFRFILMERLSSKRLYKKKG